MGVKQRKRRPKSDIELSLIEAIKSAPDTVAVRSISSKNRKNHPIDAIMMDNSSDEDDDLKEFNDKECIGDKDEITSSDISSSDEDEEEYNVVLEEVPQELEPHEIIRKMGKKRKWFMWGGWTRRKKKRSRRRKKLTEREQYKEARKAEAINDICVAQKQNIEGEIGFLRRGYPQNTQQYEENNEVRFEIYDQDEVNLMRAIERSLMLEFELNNARLAHSNKMTDVGLTESQIFALQTRELTEEDYEVLCTLDEHVEKPHVEENIMSSFPKRQLEKVPEDYDCCMICLDCFQCEDTVCELPRCSHFFHSNCLETWLGEHSRACPLCNTKVHESFEE